VGGGFALLDPRLRRPAAVVEVDDGPGRPGERGDDEADRGEEVRQRELTSAASSGSAEVPVDQHAQAEVLLHLAGPQQPGSRGHRGTPDLDAERGLHERQHRPDVASPIGWCPPRQRGASGAASFRGR
jgi:hypothetical protein